jgi:hypothetical protein
MPADEPRPVSDTADRNASGSGIAGSRGNAGADPAGDRLLFGRFQGASGGAGHCARRDRRLRRSPPAAQSRKPR